ncbi:MAG: hypothetical protein ABSF90_28020 [Syntrophobacteraceae bacterium]|jgi:hypothetical protein
MARAYTIRDFPEDLHRNAKSAAALEGISLRELILKSLRVYVEGGDRQSYPISIEFEGKTYSATYTVESGVVEVSSLYGSEETLRGGSSAQNIAGVLFRSILQGSKERKEIKGEPKNQ